MKLAIFLFSFVLFQVGEFAQMQPYELYAYIEDRLYFISNYPMSRFEAQTRCNQKNMTLVSIETQAEDEALKKFYQQAGIFEYHWLSGMKHSGYWSWSGSGQLMNFFGWDNSTGQPDYEGTEDVCLISMAGMGWDDVQCEPNFAALFCEQKC